MTIRRVQWKRQNIEISGDDTKERNVKMWFTVEEMDLDNENTLTKAFKDKMDWFVAPPSDGGHGGPMTDTHSNRVVGDWNAWGEGLEPETGKAALWVSGSVHRGPGGGPFPEADIVWNDAKNRRVAGGSWGGTKMEGYFEWDTSTGQFLGNTIESVVPCEISLVRPAVPTARGNPSIPAVPHATIIEIAEGVKSTEANEDEWIGKCLEKCHIPGKKEAEEFCKRLHDRDYEGLSKFFSTKNQDATIESKRGEQTGTPRTEEERQRRHKEIHGEDEPPPRGTGLKSIEGILHELRSTGDIPDDATKAVRSNPIAAQYVGEMSLDGSAEEARKSLQRILDGPTQSEEHDMDDKTAQELTTALDANTKALEAKSTEEPKADPIGELKSLFEKSFEAFGSRLTTMEETLKAKKEDEDEEKPKEEEKKAKVDEEEKPKDEEEKKKAKKEDEEEKPDEEDEKKSLDVPDDVKAKLEELLEEQKKTLEGMVEVVKTPQPGDRPGGPAPKTGKSFDPAKYRRSSVKTQREMCGME